MSAPGYAAKSGTAHSNIQTAQSNPSLVGIEPTMHYSAYYRVSALAHHASQAYIYYTYISPDSNVIESCFDFMRFSVNIIQNIVILIA